MMNSLLGHQLMLEKLDQIYNCMANKQDKKEQYEDLKAMINKGDLNVDWCSNEFQGKFFNYILLFFSRTHW